MDYDDDDDDDGDNDDRHNEEGMQLTWEVLGPIFVMLYYMRTPPRLVLGRIV